MENREGATMVPHVTSGLADSQETAEKGSSGDHVSASVLALAEIQIEEQQRGLRRCTTTRQYCDALQAATGTAAEDPVAFKISMNNLLDHSSQ